MSETLLQRYDAWCQRFGAAALVLREHLVSVEGPDGVVFPATFAASEDRTFKGGYNIDELPGGKNVCLIDSVGSQANRIEPLFGEEGYKDLVPRIQIKAGDRTVSLLQAGQRAGDAIIRCSALQEDLQNAFRAALKGDAEPLAKLGPTSIVFGVWDSRGTQAKLPRLVSSTIRAYDVRRLTRSAVYVPAVDYVDAELLGEPADTKTKDKYAERGFVHVPASATHGGVIATGGIRREAVLQLAALRLLAAMEPARTLILQRYILGLALIAFTAPSSPYLRQGCTLVRDPDRAVELWEVQADGTRLALTLTHAQALEFAKAAAQAFGVGADREVPFVKERAEKDLAEDEKKTAAKKSGKKAAAKTKA